MTIFTLVEINIYRQVRGRFSPFGHPSASNTNWSRVCWFWNADRLSISYATSYWFIISYYSSQVRDFKIKAFIKLWVSHVWNSSSIFAARKLFYCGHHVSDNALVFSRSIGNKRRCTPSFSQRLLVKLHRYCATIRGSKLSLFQVYFAVSLLPFCASRQPKYISSYCCSYLLSRKLLVFFIMKRFHLVYLGFVEIAFMNSVIAKAYCQIAY